MIFGAKNSDSIMSDEFAVKFKIETSYEGYENLAVDSSVDIVYIGSINSTHYELCKLFLNAGKHVACEKTFCLTLSQTEEVYALAKEKNLFIMEAFWTAFLPSFAKANEIIASGLLGKIRFVQASFGYPISEIERIKNPKMGGGGLLDLGVYR